jgi:protein-S-isoprenylcysteine O-methyltransferase Ste14
MFAAHPISFVQLSTFWAISAVFLAGILWVALQNVDRPTAKSRRLTSTIGIALQTLGFVAAAIGFTAPSLPWWAPYSLASTILVVLLGITAIILFLSAALTLGKNWSLVARTRTDHQLVRNGPFAVVRHPIYLALLLYVLSIAAALGHWQQLLFAMPLYMAGTVIRIRDEEKLLRAQFGEAHARYVRDVPSLIPLLL